MFTPRGQFTLMLRLRLAIPFVASLITASPALAQPDPSGIDFVTIGNPGNAPWTGGGFNNNRGEVDYAYRIGRYEVTSAQWCQFMNAALDRPANDHIPNVFAPEQWGAVSTTPTNPGGQHFVVPAGREMIPTGGVDWRTCAIFCNWLCNGKSSQRSAFMNGAYDVSTFSYYLNGPTFTDQLTRNPGAQYYIPSLDEWMKAAHYDPNRFGQGQGGWWLYSNTSNSPYVYAPPPSMGYPGTANASWTTAPNGANAFNVPLGAYVGVTSPWGLYDVAGATGEWLEEYLQEPGEMFPRDRYWEGSRWTFSTTGSVDTAGQLGGGDNPTFFGYDVGLRIAAAVPAPGTSLGVLIGIGIATASRRRSR